MSRLPIRLRLTLAFAVAMAAVIAAMGFVVYHRVGGALLASVDQTLRSQSTDALAHLRGGEHSLIDRDLAGATTLTEVVRRDGTVVGSTPARLPSLLPPAELGALAPRGQTLRSIALASPRGEWRVLAARAGSTGDVVVVARSLAPRAESLHRLFRGLLVAGPLALVLASLAGYGLAAAALRPVEAMRRRAAAVSASSPGRLPVPRGRDELSRLATTLNDMLGRLEASLEHERRFVADASHELRTPLALLRAELEIALRRPRSATELEATIRSGVEETERLSRLADDLLLIARADRGALPLRRDDLLASDILQSVGDRFARQAERCGATIHIDWSDESVDGDCDRLEQALGNLLDNALSHGATRIELSARRNGRAVELHVADDGPGFPEEFLDRAFDRFSRADEARAAGGTGLGLSIVSLIAAAHGGGASAANRPGGGADVWISLPGALPSARRAAALA
jgi:two-component system OmpR family sensor kinase